MPRSCSRRPAGPRRGSPADPSPLDKLPPPPPAEELRRFPRRILRRGRRIFRVHRKKHAPWYFSADGQGRFDLTELPGRGTCYLGADPAGCLLEVFWRGAPLPPKELAVRGISRLELPHSFRLADCASPLAAGFGVTGEIHAGAESYERPQAWAQALAEAGFDGIRYLVRHDSSLKSIGYALFGPAGVQGWPAPPVEPISEKLLAEVERRFGIRILPIP